MTLPAATEAVIGKALRTLMTAQGFSNVKLIGFEHNFSMSGDYPIALMTADPVSFVGAAFHCYGGTVGQIDTFRASFPTKEIHLTECSGVYGSDWWNDIKVRASASRRPMLTGGNQWYTDNLFIGGPEHYGRSSMMWNLALDGNGQPMLPGAMSCGNPCRGIVQINADGTWSVNQEFWPIAHAGKAIAPWTPGGAFAHRIAVTVGGTWYWVSPL